MSPRDLLEALETIGDAPEGVDCLRGLTMKLAMLGSLLPNGCSRDDWTKSTIGDATDTMQPGFACSKKHQVSGGHVHLRTHNINTLGQFNTDLLVEIDPDKVDPNKASLRKGDVLFNNTNSRELVGKSCVIPSDLPYGFSNHMTLLRPVKDLDSGFLWVILRALWRTGFFEQTCKAWIGQTGVNTRQLAKIEIEYPPLAEQRRIVAKVDELMALLDELERTRDERDARRAAFRDSALAALQNAEDAEAAHAAWSRIATNLADCITDPADIAPLRQTILQLAVRGRLVPQDPEDEPASELVTRTKRARDNNVNHLVASKKLRRPRKQPPIEEQELPFDTPDGWTWCRWGEIAEWITYGFTRPMPHVSEGVPIVTGKNILATGIDFSTCDFTTLDAFSQLSDKDRPSAGDLLVTKDGSIGRIAVVPAQQSFCINQSVAVVWLRSCEFDRQYLALALRSPLLQTPIQEHAKGAAVKHLSVTDFATFPLPTPPVAEQRRIVAKVDELMAICDELEQRLTEAKTHQSAFAAAAVHHLDLESNPRCESEATTTALV